MHHLARFRPKGGRGAGLLAVDLGGAEGLRRDDQLAAALRVNAVAALDHTVAHTIDQLFIGARLAQLLDDGVVQVQGGQAAVVVQRHGVVDAQGQQGLGLHINTGLVEAGFDKYRGQCVVAGHALGHGEGDRLAVVVADLQRRDDHRAGLFGLQGDHPARGALVVVAEAVELVDLAGAAHFKQAVQRRQVGFAELGDVVGFQGQFNGFPGVELVAVNAGDQAQGVRRQGPATQQKKQNTEAVHLGVS